MTEQQLRNRVVAKSALVLLGAIVVGVAAARSDHQLRVAKFVGGGVVAGTTVGLVSGLWLDRMRLERLEAGQ